MNKDKTSGPFSTSVDKVTVPLTQQQHLLLLFFPLKKGELQLALEGFTKLGTAPPTEAASDAPPAGGNDNRAATGVHFFMFYGLEADSVPQPPLPVPSFQTAPGKDLLVVMSIYDREFTPYISAFTSNPTIAAGLDAVLHAMDESGIISPDDRTSAIFIEKHGGVAKNSGAFIKLLMRYNFSDPNIPGAITFPVNTPANPKFLLGATFPGLTVGSILQNYPDANTLYPIPPNDIIFEPASRSGD